MDLPIPPGTPHQLSAQIAGVVDPLTVQFVEWLESVPPLLGGVYCPTSVDAPGRDIWPKDRPLAAVELETARTVEREAIGSRVLRFPVGEYGPQFVQNLFHAGNTLEDRAREFLRARGSDMEGGYYHDDAQTAALLHATTFRRDSGEILKEAVETVGHGLAVLAARRVRGFKTAEHLAQAAIDQGLLSKFSLILPPNVLVPMSLRGRVFDLDVVENRSGRLAFTQDFVRYMHVEREAARRRLNALPREERARRRRLASGAGCPAGRGAALPSLARAYLDRALLVEERCGPPMRYGASAQL